MGLFSKSSSSSSTQNVTEIDNPVAGALEGSQALSALGDISILDASAIDKAFAFARESLGTVERVQTAALDAQQKSLTESIVAVGNVAEESQSLIGEAQSGGAQRLLYFGAAALVALVFLAKVIK